MALCTVAFPSAASDHDDPQQLTQLTLEQLAELKVVSVSKREESNIAAPAAVHVITAEDIRRTGSISLPDALRTCLLYTSDAADE